MVVRTYSEVEELAQAVVLHAMKENEKEDFLEKQPKDSIFYKVYDDLCRTKGLIVGSYFAMHLEKKYEITFPVG